jgi:hypothetical protein
MVEGREILSASDLKLIATVHPEPDYASALGIARRICALLNAADGMTLDEAERRLRG